MLDSNMPIHDRRNGEVGTASEHLSSMDRRMAENEEARGNRFVDSPLKNFGRLMVSGTDEHVGM